jgi:hypothetical protein
VAQFVRQDLPSADRVRLKFVRGEGDVVVDAQGSRPQRLGCLRGVRPIMNADM